MENINANPSLTALTEIAQSINTIQDSVRLLEKILEIALDTLAAERGFILLNSDKTPEGFEIKSSRNLTDSQASDLAHLSTSVVQQVQKNAEPVLSFEVQNDPRYGQAESIVVQKIQSIACVPLLLKTRQIGVIYLDSLTKRSKFNPESLPFLTAFANQAAIAIENARLYESLRDENRHLRQEVQRTHGFSEIIGQHPKMHQLFDVIHRVLESDASVLIEGESGTGKELVARAIHYNGERKDKPFMAFFCGSLPDSLIESELFGHKKGAFTGAVSDKHGLFEAADRGTFFLDEIGDLSQQIQTKLLRVLQEGEIKRVGETQIRKVDVRIISATNKFLRESIKEGTFREDLFYRLNTISITLPPLRERNSDIPLLAHHFLDKYTAKRKNNIKGFTAEALATLKNFNWPGNVRELENTIERAVLMSKSNMIAAADLMLNFEDNVENTETELTLNEIQRRGIQKVLQAQNGNITETSRVLGVSRRWLQYRIKEWQL